jgi:Ca2+-binding RTX toxin-like protein
MNHVAHLSIESLESRRLLSAVSLNSRGHLRVIGDDLSDDVISIGLTSDASQIRISIAGQDDQFFNAADVRRINLYGLGGNDEIFVDEADAPFTLAVRMDGGAGSDTLRGGSNVDVIAGGAGDDSIEGGDGRNYLYGGSGNDGVFGGSDRDLLDGGSGDDGVVGYAGNDVVLGGSGNDTLWGFEGNDLLIGSAGDDEIYADGDNDTLIGGAGNDLLEGEDGDDVLLGISGADTILGGEGNDTLWGGGRNQDDLIDGGDGANVIVNNPIRALRHFRRLWRVMGL